MANIRQSRMTSDRSVMPKARWIRTCWRTWILASAIVVPLLVSPMFSASSGAAETQAPGAASNFQFSVQPFADTGSQQRSDFTYELQPGHSVLDRVVIINSSSNAETFVAYPEDATNVKGSGGFAFQQQNKVHNTTVGKWATIGQTQFTVPPGKEIVDPFQLAIPGDATPGDHVGGIVVQQLRSPAQAPSKEGVNLVLRIAVPIFVRVVGPVRPGMTIESVNVRHSSPLFPYLSGSTKVAVTLTLVNTGNVILTPKTATMSITALVGGTLHSFTVHRHPGSQSQKNPLPAEILPGGQFTLTEVWSGAPPYEPLTAHASALANNPTSSVPIVANASTTFWYFPWLPILIVVLLIVGLILWRRWRRREHIRGPVMGGASSAGESAGATPKTVEEVSV